MIIYRVQIYSYSKEHLNMKFALSYFMVDISPDKKSWLKAEVLKWFDKGIIYESQADEILSEYGMKSGIKKPEVSSVNVVKVLAYIGAVLVGLGAILFVAANWQEIPRLIKVMMLSLLTLGTFYAGYHIKHELENREILGKALIFMSTLFYGGSIFLIGQMYNINANSHWLVLLWFASIFPVAYFLDELPTYVLSSVLLIIWSFQFSVAYDFPNYAYPILVFLLMIPLSKKNEIIKYINIAGLGIAQIPALVQHHDFVIMLWLAFSIAFFYLYKDRTYSIVASVLAIFWGIASVFSYENILPYFYLLPFAYFIYLTYKNNYMPEFVITAIGFWIWIMSFLGKIVDLYVVVDPGMIHFTLTQLSLCFLYYGIASVHVGTAKENFGKVFKYISYITFVVLAYVMSFNGFHEEFSKEVLKLLPSSAILFMGIAVFLVVVSIMMKKLNNLEYKFTLPIYLFGFIATSLVMILPESYGLNTFMFNILFFVLSIGIILYGFEAQNTIMFNVGIALFVLLMITRYFDLFWGMMDRSIFFIFGGIVLIVGSLVLDKKRRKVLEDMKGAKE